MCNQKFKINTADRDINKDVVAGMMAAGSGNAQLKHFSAALDLPIMTDYTYQKSHDQICDEWEATAWDEMKKAGEKEREAAIKEGRVNINGIPKIDVIVD